ncbi:hypothetical protein MUP77_04740 [Candidatus Bathyarchaeota archaeon]|nr:hypothetical protein [Candidatus Bathyarchaeota archaeon]
MSQRTNTLEDYVRDVGKYLKRVDEHVKFIYSTIDEINKKLKETEEAIARLRTETTENTNVIVNLKENTVQKLEFEEFVSRLTESLKNLLPTLPTADEETKKEQ